MLIGLFTLTLPIKFFLPLSWILDVASANIASRPYDGDVVVVQMDIREDSQDDSTPNALPLVISRLAANPPDRVVIDHTPLSAMTAEGAGELASAIRLLPQKPYMAVPIYAERQLRLGDIFTLGDRGMQYRATAPHPDLRPFVIQANGLLEPSTLGAPINIPADVTVTEGGLPSLADILSRGSQSTLGDLPIDQRIDPGTVPVYSAERLLAGAYSSAAFENRQVILAAHGVAARDVMRTARAEDTPRAVMLALAEKTVRDGPSVDLGPLPAFLLAVLAVVAWSLSPRPRGRTIGIATLFALTVSPFLLHYFLVFHDPSQGIMLLLTFGAYRLWKRYSDALQQANDAAESKSWFLAQASHDLRQPIHAIGMLSARLGGTELTPLQHDLVRKIERSVDGASRMFKSLLDIAALENGSLEPVIAPVSVNQILAEVDEIQGLAAERAGVELRFVPSEAVIFTDRALAVTVVQNLVSNAIKYATGRKIVVGARRRGNRVTLAVYDRGAGIARKDLEQVSTKFVRVDVPKQAEGTGLGLAIVERICSLLSLKFRIRSRQGHGTSALVEGFEATVEQRKETVPDATTGSPLLKNKRILIVDDDHETLLATEAVVRQWGCLTESRTDLPEKPDCDLILTDFDLGAAGTIAMRKETLEALRRRDLRTIVLSGHATSFIEQELGDAVFAVLPKPLRPVELRSAILSAMVKSVQ